MKTEAQIVNDYKANSDEVAAAGENAVQTLQDEYGFDVVTEEFIQAHQTEYLMWFESSIEALIESKFYR